MLTDSELGLTSWGLGDFQAAELTAYVCMDGLHMHTPEAAGAPLSAAAAAARGADLTLVHGAPVELGFRVSPPPSCSNPESFLDMWIREAKRISLDVEFTTTEGVVINVGTSSIMTCSTSDSEKVDEKKIILHRKDATTLFMSKVIVVQVESAYTALDINLCLSLGVLAAQSKIPSVPRGAMGQEEQAIRAFLETGRYCPPKISPRLSVLTARIVNAVSIMPWSRSLGMWTHVLGVTISNTHPYKRLCIDKVSLVLDDTLLSDSYRFSSPIISETYDVRNLNDQACPVDVGPSGSYTFAFQLKAKFLSCIDDSNGVGKISDISDTVTKTNSISAATNYGLSAAAAFPHAFSTPLQFKWRGKRELVAAEGSCPPAEGEDTGGDSSSSASGANDKLGNLQESLAPDSDSGSGFTSQFSSLLRNHLITSIDYILWSACVPLPVGDPMERELLLFTAAEYKQGQQQQPQGQGQQPENLKIESIFVDISGPSVVQALKSFPVTVRVTNASSTEKHLVMKIASGVCSIDLSPSPNT
jgi:hypothetical protein